MNKQQNNYKDDDWVYYIAQIGHEIRTPLNVVHGFGELLQSESIGPLNDIQKQYMGKILNSADDLLQIVNQILDWAKLLSDQMKMDTEPMDLWVLLMELAEFFQLSFEKAGLTAIYEIERDLNVVCDRLRMKQAFVNIIGNALKYVPSGGVVKITGTKADGICVIQIEDNGPGIPKGHLDNIFDPFNRGTYSQKEKQGAGLGLWTARAIMEAHDGSLEVENVPTGGSCFTLTIPAS